MSSNNIPLLSFNGNILAGTFIYTEKVIAGQYNSLNIVVKSDVNLQVTAEFSGDGTYWDYSISSNVVAATNKAVTITIQAKWIRLKVSNTSLVDSTYVRLYTYGSPTNSSVLAQLASIGNLNPVVDIGNLPTDFATPNTLQQYKFQCGPTAVTNPATNFVSMFPELYLTHTGASVASQFSYTNNGLSLITNNGSTLDDILDTPYNIDTTGCAITFSSKYVSTTNSTLGGIAVVGAGSNFGDRVGVGYYKTSANFTYSDWGLYLAPAGAVTFISRASFNVDPCDGTVNLPVLDLTNFQTFKIVITPSSVDLYIQYGNEFNLVHKYSYTSNTTPMLRDYAFGYFMRTFIDAASVATTGNLSVTCSDWLLCQYGNSFVSDDLNQSLPAIQGIYYNVGGSNTGAGILFASIENYTLYQSVSCLKTIEISNIMFTSTSINALMDFKIYRTSVLAGTSYGYIDAARSNARVSTTGTITTRGQLLYHVLITAYQAYVILPINIPIRAGESILIESNYTGTLSISYTFSCNIR